MFRLVSRYLGASSISSVFSTVASNQIDRRVCWLAAVSSLTALATCLPQTAQSEEYAAPTETPDTEQARNRSSEGASTSAVTDSAYKPFAVYNRQGNEVAMSDVVLAMHDKDVVLLGETHDDAIAHQLQLQLLSEAHAQMSRQGRQVALSLEMFERDVQGVMDEYLAGMIAERDLLRDARPWPNYESDYRPLVELARAAPLPVICANAPRRYVSLAGRRGRGALEALPAAAKQWLPPLPYGQPSQAYVQKTNSTMRQAAVEMAALRSRAEQAAAGSAGQTDEGHAEAAQALQGSQDSSPEAGSASAEQPGDVAGERGGSACPYIGCSASSSFLDAQSLWDAAMAYSIAEHFRRTDACKQGHSSRSSSAASSAEAEQADAAESAGTRGPIVVHVCGKFHSEGGYGITEHLAEYAPTLRVLVVTFVPTLEGVAVSEEAFKEGQLGLYGNFVVLTNLAAPRSYEMQHPL